MIASEIHEIKEYKKPKVDKKTLRIKNPWVSVVIPAHNEELSIESTVESVLANEYVHFEVIVVDDGSADSTAKIVAKIIRKQPGARLKLIRQKNSGKSHALNNAIINHARGSLVMCLDADSMLAKDGIQNAVKHFQRNKNLVALASNMKVVGPISILNVAQRIEYIVANRFKRSLSVLNTEYIIGGIGSTFRKSYLKRVGYYDTNTMTEDIDLSMKIINKMGNRKFKIDYGYDVHTFTQGVPNLKDLIKQRYRWKYGRMQTFYKNRDLFFSRSTKHSRLLTFFQLPHAVFGDMMLAVEPIILVFLAYNIIVVGNIGVIFWGLLFMGLYVSWIISSSSDDRFGLKEKSKLILIAPFSWILFYIITFVDFCAFVKCMINLADLSSSLNKGTAKWDHVERIA